jgi:hypothetical protein
MKESLASWWRLYSRLKEHDDMELFVSNKFDVYL